VSPQGRQLPGIAAGESTHSGCGVSAKEPKLNKNNRMVMQVFFMRLSPPCEILLLSIYQWVDYPYVGEK
jgi:hypothetical protein